MENQNHFSVLIQNKAKQYGERAAMYYRNENKQWLPISWNKFNDDVETIASALIELKIKEKDFIGFFSQNMNEIIIGDFANHAAKVTSVPVYATSTAPQLKYIVDNAEISIIWAGEQYQYDIAIEVMKTSETLRKVIAIDPSIDLRGEENAIRYSELIELGKKHSHAQEIAKRRATASDDDLMCILYTSGTTGEPKGVCLHQSNFNEIIRTHKVVLNILSDKDTSMGFLPLSHIYERAWEYFCFEMGIKVYINQNPKEILTTMLEVRPTIMCAVPRYWEKVYAAINEKVSTMPNFTQKLLRKAIKIGKRYNLDYKRHGKKAPANVATAYKFFAKPLFNKVKKAAGIENGRLFSCGGARLSDEICEFMHALDINVCMGYGLTESTATAANFPADKKGIVFGSSGKILMDLKVKISDEGEILLKGETIFKGYYKKPKETAEAFTEDGYFKTGDAGYIDNDNNLFITDRIKDLFKTAGGKYIAPQMLEGLVCDSQYIEQAVAIGNEFKYVSMLIVPDYNALEKYAASSGLEYNNHKELIALPQVVSLYSGILTETTKELAQYEQIKKFTLLENPLTIEQGHLTSTLKIKRKVINELFAKEIKAMYPDEFPKAED